MEPDRSLYQRVRQGDLEAFDTLYAHYERPLFGFILRMLREWRTSSTRRFCA